MKPWIETANKAIAAALSMLEKQPAPRLSVWAEAHFYMSAESSYVEGAWKAYPPQRFLLDCAGDDRIEQFNILVCFADWPAPASGRSIFLRH